MAVLHESHGQNSMTGSASLGSDDLPHTSCLLRLCLTAENAIPMSFPRLVFDDCQPAASITFFQDAVAEAVIFNNLFLAMLAVA